MSLQRVVPIQHERRLTYQVQVYTRELTRLSHYVGRLFWWSVVDGMRMVRTHRYAIDRPEIDAACAFRLYCDLANAVLLEYLLADYLEICARMEPGSEGESVFGITGQANHLLEAL